VSHALCADAQCFCCREVPLVLREAIVGIQEETRALRGQPCQRRHVNAPNAVVNAIETQFQRFRAGCHEPGQYITVQTESDGWHFQATVRML
jgi:hypothetical protein